MSSYSAKVTLEIEIDAENIQDARAALKDCLDGDLAAGVYIEVYEIEDMYAV